MAEDKSLNFFDDALLVSEAKSTDRIGLFRKDSSGNNEKTVTVSDLIASINPDYTSLTEQLVPGEFWVGVDGIKRQVYVQTFIGTINPNTLITPVRGGVRAAQIVYGYCANDENSTKDPFPFTLDIDNPDFGKAQRIYNTQGNGSIFLLHTMVAEALQYVATFKFTKL